VSINIPRKRRYPMRSMASSFIYGASDEFVDEMTVKLRAGVATVTEVYLFDPESGLHDPANKIVYRGQTISPVLLRVNRPPSTATTNGDQP
jgi:hypothetical protein